MEVEEFEGCISCMKTKDLCDLFTVYGENAQTYAKMFETCFNVKIADELKFICSTCAHKLQNACTFRELTLKTINMVQVIKDEEYLDEELLEADDKTEVKPEIGDDDPDDDSTKASGIRVGLCSHMDNRHPCDMCAAVFASARTLKEHKERSHGIHGTIGGESKQYPCHFCENVYSGRKACYTHLRMKHGLKLSTEQAPKFTPRQRKQCHVCNKDFSQQQILNKHLWKAHGYEVEKRKAFQCPLCESRVSYGHHFDQHLLTEHRLKQHVETLQFPSMDDFIMYKSQVQEQTRCRFRKTTASKHTIEGLRSHYMCSQSGVYVYQGKGIRPAPERQIYKTGKACPAHIVVTESVGGVRVVFHSTHVGHGACPYYEPRESRKSKSESSLDRCPGLSPGSATYDPDDLDQDLDDSEREWLCDTCGESCDSARQFATHCDAHSCRLLPCIYCDSVFENIEWLTKHLRSEHNIGTFM
ncbi:uncharacterized protein LOC105391688 [Plutella xylostella]|uniref:uncharacterized protein LOC105391688 n=1 Tax=Plutella xylostella TaxID=51655 RepID=UPI0005D05E03|nr:uncharacterized protein LOC105391688 [Plutella xylostella]